VVGALGDEGDGDREGALGSVGVLGVELGFEDDAVVDEVVEEGQQLGLLPENI